MADNKADIAIIGAGMGGATSALALAGSGARIVILDHGYQLPFHADNRDARAIFQRGVFRPKENWYDPRGKPFGPGNYYYHGGNTKFYGAVLMRYRASDFDGVEHMEGRTPAWPFRYGEIEPWYQEAERIYRVRGSIGEDATEPYHSGKYHFSPVPDEPSMQALRSRLRNVGLHPASLPLGIDIDRWLEQGPTTWDAFPDARSGKMDAETCALLPALSYPNVRIESGAEVVRFLLGADGKRIAAVEYRQQGELKRLAAETFLLSAGAVRSAKILLASAETGLANRSGAVGRNFMNHNLTALLAFDPKFRNDSVYQKTFGMNDFYLDEKGNYICLHGSIPVPVVI